MIMVIYWNNETTSANLFDQFSYDNELSLHDRVLNLIRNEDPDTFTDQKFNNPKPAKHRNVAEEY